MTFRAFPPWARHCICHMDLLTITGPLLVLDCVESITTFQIVKVIFRRLRRVSFVSSIALLRREAMYPEYLASLFSSRVPLWNRSRDATTTHAPSPSAPSQSLLIRAALTVLSPPEYRS